MWPGLDVLVLSAAALGWTVDTRILGAVDGSTSTRRESGVGYPEDGERRDGGRPEMNRHGGVVTDARLEPEEAEPSAELDASRPACRSLYGDGAGFSLCGERTDECEFYEVLSGTPCRERCERGGGECRGSFAEAGDPPYECERSSGLGCDYPHGNGICICSR